MAIECMTPEERAYIAELEDRIDCLEKAIRRHRHATYDHDGEPTGTTSGGVQD